GWQDLVTASLLGTERVPVPATAGPGLSSHPGTDVAADPAAQLLDLAVLATVARRAGRLPDQAELPPAADVDPGPAVSPAAGHRLQRILGGENPDLLAEWLTAVVSRGYRVPEHLLPALLDRARRGAPADQDLRRLAAPAGGACPRSTRTGASPRGLPARALPARGLPSRGTGRPASRRGGSVTRASGAAS